MATYVDVILYSLIGGLVSLVGGILLLSRKSTAIALARYATPFAAGALLAAAFFDLLPEAVHALSGEGAMRWALVGMVTFFLLEHFLHWFHHHHEHSDEHTPAYLVVIGDTLHNLLDGIAIGAAFLISVPTGIVTAVAVAAHEIPQEIGDFGVLLRFGFARKKVLLINAMSALMSTVGAVGTFWIGSQREISIGILLALTGGMFVYVAASDLIPMIHKESRKKRAGHVAVVLLLAGVLVVGVTAELTHRYVSNNDHAKESHGTQDDLPAHDTSH
jgi:zinc and cadmium transporter